MGRNVRPWCRRTATGPDYPTSVARSVGRGSGDQPNGACAAVRTSDHRTVKELGPNLRSWASEVDEATVEQARTLARLPILAGPVALMPDAHLGIGATVG